MQLLTCYYWDDLATRDCNENTEISNHRMNQLIQKSHHAIVRMYSNMENILVVLKFKSYGEEVTYGISKIFMILD